MFFFISFSQLFDGFRVIHEAFGDAVEEDLLEDPNNQEQISLQLIFSELIFL